MYRDAKIVLSLPIVEILKEILQNAYFSIEFLLVGCQIIFCPGKVGQDLLIADEGIDRGDSLVFLAGIFGALEAIFSIVSFLVAGNDRAAWMQEVEVGATASRASGFPLCVMPGAEAAIEAAEREVRINPSILLH